MTFKVEMIVTTFNDETWDEKSVVEEVKEYMDLATEDSGWGSPSFQKVSRVKAKKICRKKCK